MPKRAREPDPETQDLIDSLQDQDELESIQRNYENERATIETIHASSLETIRKEFKTLDPETLPERDQLRLKQKLEFEEGLHKDRLKALEAEKVENEETQVVKVTRRRKRRHIDLKLQECESIAEMSVKEIEWRLIGKNRHLQHILKDVKDKMSEEQHQKYETLMKDLKKNGHKIFS
jgi:hypothetical protein